MKKTREKDETLEQRDTRKDEKSKKKIDGKENEKNMSLNVKEEVGRELEKIRMRRKERTI